MSNSAATPKSKVKRRWAFSRGKVSDSKIVLLASGVTIAVFALSFTVFEYRNDAPPERVQKSALYQIDNRSVPEFFKSFRGPEAVFSSSLKMLPPRQSPGTGVYTDELPVIANVPELKSAPFHELRESVFPVSVNYFTPPKEQKFFPAAVSKVIDAAGRELFSIGFPPGVTGKKYRKNTVIQLNSYGKNIQQLRVIESSGIAELDNFAMEKISSRELPGGIYAVLWGDPDDSASGGGK